MNKIIVCIIAKQNDSLYTAETPKQLSNYYPASPGHDIIDDKASNHELKYS